jgi:hypothetical protein
MQLKLFPYADVSTGHITQEDAQRLDEDARATDERRPRCVRRIDETARLIVFADDAGFFVHTAVAEELDELAALATRDSASLLTLLQMAQEQQAVFLRLDRDGRLSPDLPVYQW